MLSTSVFVQRGQACSLRIISKKPKIEDIRVDIYGGLEHQQFPLEYYLKTPGAVHFINQAKDKYEFEVLLTNTLINYKLDNNAEYMVEILYPDDHKCNILTHNNSFVKMSGDWHSSSTDRLVHVMEGYCHQDQIFAPIKYPDYEVDDVRYNLHQCVMWKYNHDLWVRLRRDHLVKNMIIITYTHKKINN